MAKDGLIAERVVARLEEQLVALRHRPRALVDIERHVEVASAGRLRGFRRHLCRRLIVTKTDPVFAALVAAVSTDVQRRALAARLVLRVEADSM